jgi:hypothetical protein
MTFRPLSTEDILGALERDGLRVRRVRDYYQAQCPCPSHPDEHPSLVFGNGRRDEGAFIRCLAGCSTPSVVRALRVNGTAAPLTREELARRRAAEEADRNERSARARAHYELALEHPDRRHALEWFAPALKWDVDDLLRRGVGWSGDRVVFPIVVDDVVVGIDRYAPPGSIARTVGEEKLLALGVRGLWPGPETVKGLRFVVEGAACAATMLGVGLAAIAYPSAKRVLCRAEAERLRDAGTQDLIVLADGDAVGRQAARVSVLTLRGVGLRARAVDLFPDIDDGRDVADELRTRDDGVDWLLAELAEFITTTEEVHAMRSLISGARDG